MRDPSSGPEPLSDEEETLLRRYYEAKIMKVCAAFSLPSKVQATAVTLFKRFLLDTSLLQHNLKTIMLTSVYLACKTEEHYVSAEELGRGMHEDAGRVLNAELHLTRGSAFSAHHVLALPRAGGVPTRLRIRGRRRRPPLERAPRRVPPRRARRDE